MASGAAPCSEQRPSAVEKEKGGGGIITGRGRRHAWLNAGHMGLGHCEMCVVCGDRACNHHYYGVAACHGCKCFFWRSIKNKMKYICRGDGQCEINPNHRNACRYCRLQRCLKAGMQPEAVRMPKEMTEDEEELAKLERAMGMAKANNRKGNAEEIPVGGHCPLCHQQKEGAMEVNGEKPKGNGAERGTVNDALIGKKELGQQNQEERSQLLVKKLVDIEMNINEVVDFSENEAPKRQLHLDSLFDYPEYLDRFRTQVNYCVRLRRVTEEEMEFCKYRTLTKVFDYIRSLSSLDLNNPIDNGKDQLTVQDKIVLLRRGFAPLVLFDIAAGTSFATKDTQNLLCLPTGLTLCAGEPIVPNTFLSQQIVSRCIGSLVRLLTELQMDQEEFVMMKLIIALALDSASGEEAEEPSGQQSEGFSTSLLMPIPHAVENGHILSPGARQFVDQLRDLAHAALYRHSPKKAVGHSAGPSSAPEAALRFAKLLHILPKLTLLSRDLVEHIRMVHTFPSTSLRPTDPLFYQLFGDIFHENQQNRLSVAFSGGSPYSNGDLGSSFGSPQQEAEEQREGDFVPLIIGGCPVNPKMISPPYKMEEYGGSSLQLQKVAQAPPTDPDEMQSGPTSHGKAAKRTV